MDILFGVAMIFVLIVLVMFIYSFFQDIFAFFVAPSVNERLDRRVSVLYQMGFYESADIVRLQFIRSWMDLIR